jgi:hypothetical protein
MEPLDGNAIAGPLFEHFGVEMTLASGFCRHCGAPAQIAELRVYTRAPGTVVRCRSCGQAVIVLIRLPDDLRVDLGGFQLLKMPGEEG